MKSNEEYEALEANYNSLYKLFKDTESLNKELEDKVESLEIEKEMHQHWIEVAGRFEDECHILRKTLKEREDELDWIDAMLGPLDIPKNDEQLQEMKIQTELLRLILNRLPAPTYVASQPLPPPPHFEDLVTLIYIPD